MARMTVRLGCLFAALLMAAPGDAGEVTPERLLNSGVIGVPSSFEVDGKQYIAVEAGWGIDAAGMQTRLAASYPDRFVSSTRVPTGGAIWVFALPD
jgi:alcohol dehydrogenase (cytochrome c)